jgi:hypothetical protein
MVTFDVREAWKRIAWARGEAPVPPGARDATSPEAGQ